MRLLQRAASGAAVLVLLSACGTATEQGIAPVETTPTPKPTPSATITAETPTPSATATPAQGDVIDYRPGGDTTLGLMMATPEDAKKLAGAPADFVDFIAAAIETNAKQEGCDETITTNVSIVDPKGWAAGSVTGCGGFRTIWKGSEDGWDVAWSGQDLPTCARLGELKAPVAIVAGAVDRAQCLDGSDIKDYAG